MPDEFEPPLEFSSEEWNIIKPILHRVELETGVILFKEGTEEKDLYFLIEGSLTVTKKGLTVATLGPGNWVGEIAALTGENKRTASVAAEKKCILWKLSLDALSSVTQDNQKIYLKLITALSKAMANRVRSSTDVAIEHKLEIAQTKVVMAEFLCAILFGLTSFLYAVEFIRLLNLKPKVTAAVSIPLILLLSYFCLTFIKRSGLPISSFGLTWKNWQKSVSESLLCTIPLILVTLLIKWTIISTVPMFKDDPLMNFHHLLKSHLATADWLLITIGYSLFVPLQALMVNGCMQTVFTKFFVGPNNNFLAIVLSNLLFSITHLRISLSLAIFVFFVGCVWGWLYSRHQTIVGISVSHMILGIWSGLFMGFI